MQLSLKWTLPVRRSAREIWREMPRPPNPDGRIFASTIFLFTRQPKHHNFR
jgi:hypothetical protein